MAQTPLYSQAYQSYLLAQEARHLSPNYRTLQALSRDYWLRKYPDRPLGDYTADDIRVWLVWLGSDDAPGQHALSSASVDIHYRSQKAFWLWAEREELVNFGESPVRKVPRPKHSERLPDILTPDEMNAMLKAVLGDAKDPNRFRNYCILLFFGDTGCRLEEVTELTWGQVNLEQGYVRVIGKGDKERVVKLGIELRRALSKYRLQYRKAVDGEPALFTNDMGFKFEKQGIRMMVLRMLKAHVPRQLNKYGPHGLRHFAATIDLLVNKDLDATRRKLGHQDAAITRRYTHLADIVRQSGISPMDAVLAGAHRQPKRLPAGSL